MNRLRPLAWSIAGAAVAAALVLAAVAQEPAKSESQKAFEAAQALYDAGQWDRALAAFRQFEKDYSYSMLREQAVFFEGWCYYSQKKYDLAAQEFGRVRQTFARGRMAPAATLKEAESWREMKEFDKSLGVYREFQRLWPEDDLTPQSILGESWTLYKRWMFEREQDKEKGGNPRDLARAKELTLLVREKYKQNFTVRMDSLFLLGQLYNAEENFAEARKAYEEIRSMRNNPRATEALFLAAEALYDSKQYDEAIRNYQRVKSKDALIAEIRVSIATLRSELPRHPERRNSILAAINEQQTFGSQVTGQQNLRPLALFRTANSYQELGRPEEACIVYRHFLRLYPEDQLAKQAHFGLTQALTAAGRPAEAERELDLFKKKYGGQEGAGDFVQSALFLKAKALFDTGKYQEAQRGFREFLETKPEARLQETAEFYIAGSDYGLENYAASRDAFAKFLADHPESALAADAQFRLARSFFELSQRAEEPDVRQENLTKAADQFEAYRAKHATAELLPEAVFQLGYIYGYLGEFDTNNFTRAIGAFREFIEKWPDHATPNGTALAPEALYQVGTSQLALGDTDAAAATFQAVIDKYPDTPLAPAAAFDKGRVYATAGQSEELVAALRAFVARYPDHALVPRALLAMGDDLLGRNEIEPAFAEYRKLIAFTAKIPDPTEDQLADAIRAQARIGVNLRELDKVDEAVDSWSQFLDQFKNHPTPAGESVNQIAALLGGAGQFDQAYTALDALATKYNTISSIRIAAYTSIVELANAKKHHDRAYAAVLRLLADPEKDNLPTATYLAIATTLYNTERHAEARQALDGALTRAAGDPRTLPQLLALSARTWLKLNQSDKAEADAKKLLAEFPNSRATIAANLVLAKVFYAQAGKLAGEAQKKMYKDAIDLANYVMGAAKGEDSAEAAMICGIYFLTIERDCKTALPYFLRVTFLTGGPLAEEAAFRVGEAQECLSTNPQLNADQRAGARQAACTAYQAYVKRFPSGRFAGEAGQKAGRLCAPLPAP